MSTSDIYLAVSHSGFMLFFLSVLIRTDFVSSSDGTGLICGGMLAPRSEVTVSTSGFWGSDANIYGAPQACLNNIAGPWVAASSTAGQWISVELERIYQIDSIATQGRLEGDQRVTLYSVAHSKDGAEWTYVTNDDGENTQFQRNEADPAISVEHVFPGHVTARHVKLTVVTWIGHVSLRWEIFGTAVALCRALICGGALEPRSNVHVSESSVYSNPPRVPSADRACLHNQDDLVLAGYWIAAINDLEQWIMVQLDGTYRISAISTQGRSNELYVSSQWVTEYQLAYSENAINWILANVTHESITLFEANSDQNTVVTHSLGRGVLASAARLHPLSWYGHITMRWEIYACPEELNGGGTSVSSVRGARAITGKYSTAVTNSQLHCARLCLEDHACLAFNFNELTRACELIDTYDAPSYSTTEWKHHKLLTCVCAVP